MRFEGWDSDWLADDLLGAFELDLTWVWNKRTMKSNTPGSPLQTLVVSYEVTCS